MTADAEAKTSSCGAVSNGELGLCERCGLEWLAGAQKPDCDPVTFTRMRNALLDRIADLEVSHRILTEMRKDGEPANPAKSRKSLAEFKEVFNLVDLVDQVPALKKAVQEARHKLLAEVAKARS